MKNIKRFIVVDDDSSSNLICKFLIQRIDSNADIMLLTDPEEALVAINEEYSKTEDDAATVLLLDINMPFMTGWEFLDVFKDFDAKVHEQFTIYILSSSIEDQDKEKAQSHALVSGFLSKPMTIENLEKILEQE